MTTDTPAEDPTILDALKLAVKVVLDCLEQVLLADNPEGAQEWANAADTAAQTVLTLAAAR